MVWFDITFVRIGSTVFNDDDDNDNDDGDDGDDMHSLFYWRE